MDNSLVKYIFSRILAVFLVFLLGCSSNDRLPNIVLIMGDDIGIETMGSYGGSTYKTPNLDKLAKTGIRFTNCYSNPVCSPSRVKLMTGRYGFRTGQKWGYIPPDESTFGHVLEKEGYEVALAGKWQMALLQDNPNHIQKMGFKENCVFGWHEGPRYHSPLIYQNGKVLEGVEDKYGPDIYCDFIIDFIKRSQDKPFLAYFPMALAHDVSNDFDPAPPPGPNGKYQSYKELVEYMDVSVGRIVRTLDSLKLRENTLILFTGDNGTPEKFITEYKDGKFLKEPIYSILNGDTVIGGKKHLTDAGTHVPLIANWKGVTKQGVINEDLIDFSDFFPTLLDITGSKIPENLVLDGNSFAPQLFGEKGNPRTWAYNEWEGNYWIRNHKWKLYNSGKLYDMESDPLEKNPIIESNDDERTKKVRVDLYDKLINQGGIFGLD